jgi:2-methylcitrate dehydratase PrpD
MTILERFAEFIYANKDAKFDSETLHHARRALLDWQGALIAGANAHTADLLRLAYKDELHDLHDSHISGLCSVAGTHLRAAPRAAAFLNGTISHIAEFDDIYRDGGYHPASPTISAVFALAQARDYSLDDLLRAIILGYEVSTRISRVIQPSHYVYFHTTGTVGVFGAAAACAALLKLGVQQTCSAMAIAGTFASGLQEAFRSDSMTKPMHAGHAAEVGLSAALSAEVGMTGAPRLLEGDAGFGAAMSKHPRWSEIFEALGEHFSISSITFKNHGCCGHTFPAIDAVANLVDQHKFNLSDIKRIRVGGYRQTVEVCAYRHPQTQFEAKFSVSYTVAARLVLGRVREDAFLLSSLKDPVVRALEDKVELYLDNACANDYPTRRSARVEIELSDGQILVQHQMTRHGDPDDPLTDQELIDKFRELVEPRLGHVNLERILNSIIGAGDMPVRQIAAHWALKGTS